MNSLLKFVISYAKFLKHHRMISNSVTVTNFSTILKRGITLFFKKKVELFFQNLQ